MLLQVVEATNMIQCPLCSSAATLPTRLSYQVDSTQTCLDVYLAMGKLNSTDPQCINQQTSYRDACCNATLSASFTPHPSSAPVYTGTVGDQPNCPICGTLEYPGIPSGYIVARYVGDYSCAQLYDRGLHGLIPNFMCVPLQNYAEKVCGCGVYNPNCQGDPNACWGYTSAQSQNATPSPPPAPVSYSAPSYTQPTYFQRKTRPASTGKTSVKLSSGSGGAAGRSRLGNRRIATKGKSEAHDNLSRDMSRLRIILEDGGV